MKKRTRREFIREKRRSLKKLKRALDEVRCGCAIHKYFDGTNSFHRAFDEAWAAYRKMDAITKPLA